MSRVDKILNEHNEEMRPKGDHFTFVDGPGKDVVSDSPQTLFDNAMAYFRWNKENPIVRKQKIMVGKKAGEYIEMETDRPTNEKALCLHCNITFEYWEMLKRIKDPDNEYYHVVAKISYIIEAQLTEGALINMYNPTIVTAMLKMDGKAEDNSEVKVTHLVGTGETAKLYSTEAEILENIDDRKDEWISDEETNIKDLDL